ncbi:MAG: hypothetical protein SCARUB_02472 [Candidatus Scalindua rubra]|uniref:N-sulphoglucosamine sulphohydrolase C-terminal domain-containing protein n=1 Tax=Candidatus Scalindua rubra TaxID=1872076 RepID=A0A1E3X9T9_9BACT|nr:MAG: hypothetical protein SCARUB_02472 [Candidatus Scalindua rubra]
MRGQLQPRKINSLVQGIDIAPTILDILGIEIPETFQGCSLKEIIAGRETQVHEILTLGVGVADETIAIRTKEWKLISWDDGSKNALYNLVKDPNEENNLIDLEIDWFNKLNKQLDNWLQTIPHYDLNSLLEKKKKISPRLERMLEKEGYLEKRVKSNE